MKLGESLKQPTGEVAATSEIEGQASPRSIEQEAGGAQGRLLNKHTAPWIAGSLWVLVIVFAGLALLLFSVNKPDELLAQVPLFAAFLSFPTVGALVVSRRPYHPVGWMFLAVGLTMFGVFAEQYATYTLETRPSSLPGGLLLGAIGAVAGGIGFSLAFTFLLLLFPDGRLPSRRWRPIAWLAAGFLAIYAVAPLFIPGPLPVAPTVRNPLGIEELAGFFDLLDALQTPSLIAILIAGVAAVVTRYRHGTSEVRHQLKWVVFALALLLSLAIVMEIAQGLWGVYDNPDTSGIFTTLFALTITSFPLSVGIAILKYRLYDIDLLINRTLVYVPLTGILAGLYSASVALFQRLFQAITGERSDAAIVLTTLILAAAFTPIKNTLQSVVDKRFKEAHDPTKKLKELNKQVQSVVEVIDPKQITRRLLDETITAFDAQGGAVYLWRDAQLEPVHTSEEWSEDGTAISVPIEAAAEELGRLELGARRSGAAYTEEDRQTLQQSAGLVAQAIEATNPSVVQPQEQFRVGR